MNLLSKLALIAVLPMAVPQAAVAKAPALSKAWAGTWHLDTEKSKFSSEEFTPKSDTRTYAVDGRHLTMKSTTVTGAGKTMKWSYSANTDGKLYRTSGNPNSDHVALTFVSPREFMKSLYSCES